MTNIKPMLGVAILLALHTTAAAEYAGWRHTGSVYVLTTPDGANLPAEAAVENFPLLVRLHKGFFDFAQARPLGEDIRFASSTGEPLAYQIEEWDPVHARASIWVRVPLIRGNARQEIKLYWGKPDAASESNGKAVFNETNGYVGVFHLNGGDKDETGTLDAKDSGATPTPGMIGAARHFPGKQGIFCGDKISGFPTGSNPNTTEAWFRSEVANARIMGWGNEAPQGKVILNYRSPPHVRMECYFSGADVAGKTAVQKSEWVHVVHAYQKGESLLYVNGALDGVTKTSSAPLAIKNPARMWIGGWYNVYEFAGDIDEVRVSNVARSADWARLSYENQKQLQTLVGHVVQSGDAFSVSSQQLTLAEGQTATIEAQAGGAQKVSWILKRQGREEVVATDRFQFTFDAGRIAGDESATLQFKAVYAQQVKTQEIAIAIEEALPEPMVTLKAPKTWDGREGIEVACEIANQPALQAAGVAELKTHWTTAGLAIIKETAPGKLLLKRSQNSGPLTVSATVSNGGKPTTQTIHIDVNEPAHDPWIERTPGQDERPVDNQFFARNDQNEGIVHYRGTLSAPAEKVFVKLYADDKPIQTESQKPDSDHRYALSLKLKPGLIKYKIELGTQTGGVETTLQTVNNLVCGDAYVIEGQSNAVSTDWAGEKSEYSSEWIRSFGSMEGDVSKGWGNAVRREGGRWQIGYWGMDLAKHLVETQQMPICIINGAVGGTRIDQHQRNPTDPRDKTTIYGRLLTRVEHARLTHGIRAVFWHQGEADQGADGPDGGYGCEKYQAYFLDMAGAWKQEMPNIQHYYVFQIWPNACSQGGNRHSDKLRDVQRLLPRSFARLSVMSTIGIQPEGPCHYPDAGYAQMARLIAPLVERDHYGKRFERPITAPDLKQARFATEKQDEVTLEFDQPVVWNERIAQQLYLDGQAGNIASGEANGNRIQLKLTAPTSAKTITYITDKKWNSRSLLLGQNGIAALTFCEAPLVPVAAKP